MGYKIYTTSAFILASRERGEADLLYKLYSRNIGMIDATATGIRKSGSKLSGHLRRFSIVEVSLVKGKEFWRLTGAENVKDFKNIFRFLPARLTYARIEKFISRLVVGEEKNESLFEILENGFNFMEEKLMNDELSFEEKERIVKSLEIIIMINILKDLGYIDPKKDQLSEYIKGNLNKDEIDNVYLSRKKLINIINNAIEHSHL